MQPRADAPPLPLGMHEYHGYPAAALLRVCLAPVYLRAHEANDPLVRDRHQVIVPAIEAMIGQLPPQKVIAHGPGVTERGLPEGKQSRRIEIGVVRSN